MSASILPLATSASTPPPVMSTSTSSPAMSAPTSGANVHDKVLLFTIIIIMQIVILAFGYGFLIAVAYLGYLAPSDSVCELMKNYPGELTMIVTLIATVLSVTAATSVYLLLSPADYLSFYAFGQRGTETPNVEAHFSDSPEHRCRFGTGLSYSEKSIYGIDHLNVVHLCDAEALNCRFLRSGFMATGSFPDNVIPNNLSSPVTGTMFISTIGWTRWAKNSPTYLLATVPFTIITILTCVCAGYSILEAWREHRRYPGHRRAHFDVSNTLHLIMACAAGNLKLQPFDKIGIKDNEVAMVFLDESQAPTKKFVSV
ncbi:hypothetical protein BDR04DRAFT_1121559 [Suillus decipiens]|nr:hypothetical protein BDR04DRAFT_1121559 [Suillus decipiens]